MKNETMKRLFACLIAGACSLAAPCSLSAAPPAPADECTKELLLSYFPAPIVSETLKRFNVPKDKWDSIVKSLSNKDKEIVKRVEQKASTMNPNPLKDPQQRQAAVKLFRETLLQVFTEAMNENGVTDTAKFQPMLDDIQQQKAKKFAMCMDKQKQKAFQQDQAISQNDTDADDDDSDDGDDDDSDGDDDSDEDSDDDDMDDAVVPTNRRNVR